MLTLNLPNAAARYAAALFMSIATLALPAAVPVAHAAPAEAAAQASSAGPCWGPSCIGKDPTWGSTSQRDCVKGIANPYQGGFSDAAYDVVTIQADNGTVTLRYSPLCASNWARWNLPKADGDDYWVETSDGNRSNIGDSYVLPNYTTMVDGTLPARVCWYDATGYIGNCSGWY